MDSSSVLIVTMSEYEADEQYDRFATSLATRCGAAPKWRRHRYAIDRNGMGTIVSLA